MESEPRKLDAEIAATVMGWPVAWHLCWQDPECGDWWHVNGNMAPDICEWHPIHWGYLEPGHSHMNNPEYAEVVPFYTTDARADFAVLKKVREILADGKCRAYEWCTFLSSLNELYRGRRKDRHFPVMEIALHCDLHEVGDYSRAALKAITQ